MKNNLQADLLISSKLNFFISEPFTLNKKSKNSLKVGSYLKLNSNSLSVALKSKSSFLMAKVFAKNSYLFIKKCKKNTNKFKIKKDNFAIKFNLEKELLTNQTAIAKMPINAIMLKGKKEFANINLYISNAIYIEIKEILWKRFY